MNDSITLMNKDIPVLSIIGDIHMSDSNIPYINIKDLKYINRDLCPILIFSNNKDVMIDQFNHWFNKRLISEKRSDIPQRHIELEGTPCFFSLSDQYWLRFNESQKWENLNLYKNQYDTTLGDIFFSKSLGAISSLRANYNTPDLTTNGVLKKRWKQENGTNYLIKHMSKQFGQEPISEILASHLLKQLKIIDFVEYEICIEGYDLCSKCKSFIEEGMEFVPAMHIYAATPISEEEKDIPDESQRVYMHLMKAIDKFKIPYAKDFIDNMIIADRYMLNYDRHLGNFGFIKDVSTGKFVGPAPLFDFGNAFFSETTAEVSKHFAFREKYLFDNQRIKPISDNVRAAFNEEISKCFFLDNDEKNEIIKKININNKLLQKNIHDLQDIYDKKCDHKGRIIQNAVAEDC